MSNIDSSIIRVQRLVGNHALATRDEVLSALNSRHSSLLESHDWSRKRSEIAITIQVDKSNGTIQVSNGSSTALGTSTTFTASDIGRYLRIGSDDDSLYVVLAVTSSTQITLGDFYGNTVGYAGSSASGLSYVMFTRHYTLGAGIEHIKQVVWQTPLAEKTQAWLDDEDPNRSETGDPMCWAMSPRDQSGTNDLVRVEIWPRSTTSIILTASVLKGHVDLLPSQFPIVPSSVIEWNAAVDMCYLLAARTKPDKWLPLADKYLGQAEAALEREKGEDNKKFGLLQAVRDIGSGIPLGLTDYAVDHDV